MGDAHKTEWQRIDGLDPATVEFPVEVEIGGEPILIFKTVNGHRGTEPLCPHQKVPLKTAILMNNDTLIRCSRHNFTFRLEGGAGVNCPGMKLVTYDVRERDGFLEIAVPSEIAAASAEPRQ
jgi:nitrite reductase/ring-hydroxylating ferredoxin subunit